MLTVNLSRRLKVGVLVHEVSRLRRKAIDQLLQPLGITGTQWWLLTYVSLRPGLSQARLAEELNLGKVALGGLIDRMTKNNLIERRPSDEDKRVNHVFLSGEGVKLADDIRRLSSGVLDNALKDIDPHDLDVALSVLSRMKDNLEGMTGTNKAERAGALV
jgi:DNA-binding MarR family transcriptional regulator